MIKLDNSIMQEVDLQEQKRYWRDFDEGRVAFTMEVDDNDLEGQLIDLNYKLHDIEDILQSLEAKND